MKGDPSKIVDAMRRTAKSENGRVGSQLMYGTVTGIDPLKVKAENGIELSSTFLFLTDFAIAKKVRLRVHQIHGNPKEISFTGSADELSNQIKQMVFNSTKNTSTASAGISGTVSDSVTFSSYALPITGAMTGTAVDSSGDVLALWTNPSISGTGALTSTTSKSTKSTAGAAETFSANDMTIDEAMQTIELVTKYNGNISFKIQVTEEDDNVPKDDDHDNDQTTVIEGIIWRGVDVGDTVLLTTHSDNQRWLVHSIRNRPRDQYEHGIAWSSRVSDGFKEGGHESTA